MALNLKSLDEAVRLVEDSIDKREQFYLGNLKKFGKCRPLQHYHYILSDVDSVGNLTNGVVFVQYLACRLGDKRASLLLCKECDQGADVVQQIVLHGDVGEEFLQQRREKYCIHSKAIEQFHPDNHFDLENLTFPFYFGRDLVDIEQLSSKPQKYAVLANGEYGLVTLPPRAKKVRCTNPHKMSRDCCH